MTTDANNIEPGAPSRVNDTPAAPELVDDIVSVNKKGTSDNKFAKAVFLLLVGAMLVGVMAWFSQNWLNSRKAQMKENNSPKAAEDTARVFNPEKTGTVAVKPKLGSESGLPAPSQAAAVNQTRPGAPQDEGVRALRGADGKVMVNAQGRAMGVDKDGNVVEVPAIAALSGDQPGRKPLPGEAASQRGQGQGGQAQQKVPSRYSGSLFVGEPAKPNATSGTDSGTAGTPTTATLAQTQAQQIADILRGAGLGGAQASRTGPAAPAPSGTGPMPSAPQEQARPGTVGSALHSSATPVALAKRMTDQNLILPKGRQADCVLTGRIIDEVPGFTSCVLAQNLYSDNGRVLLLERGSELTGEYGVTNQLGLERLFVTWNRLKTPEGIEIDLSSPGADRLGTSGVPGHLDNRWPERIGAALLVSFVKDITVAIINKQTQSTSGATVSVQSPGQNTINASSDLAEEVIKQTIKVRPRLTINEGDRISIYVARDLDFSPVYVLKTAGVAGATRLLTK
jgi:type IV secretion system protein VirB10